MAGSDLRKLVRYAIRDLGFIKVRHKNHIILEAPNGRRVIVPTTPCRGRAHTNCLAEIRRAARGTT